MLTTRQAMTRRITSLVAAALLAVSPASAQFSGGGGQTEIGYRNPDTTVALTRGTCATSTTNATTYTFTATGVGGVNTDIGLIVVVAMGEDALTVFGVASMTINNVAATEIIDEDGTGLVDAALYRSNAELSGTTVDIAVTFSEAVTSATVCAWKLTNLSSFTAQSSVQDDDTASGALVLTTGTTATAGFVVSACITETITQTTTWAVLTEREDADNGEHDYSNADAAGTGASMANTCDWTSTGDASGVAAAFR